MRGKWEGVVDGQTVVRAQVTWYLSKKLNEGSELDDDQYHLVVEGDPGVDSRIRFLPPDYWGEGEWEIIAALPAVNAAFNVKSARAGILSLKNVGLLTAPAGAWECD